MVFNNYLIQAVVVSIIMIPVSALILILIGALFKFNKNYVAAFKIAAIIGTINLVYSIGMMYFTNSISDLSYSFIVYLLFIIVPIVEVWIAGRMIHAWYEADINKSYAAGFVWIISLILTMIILSNLTIGFFV